MRFFTSAPPGFGFARTVHGHGWAALPPFHYDLGRRSIETAAARPRGGAVTIRVRDAGRRGLEIETSGRSRAFALAVVRRMLNLDLDLSEFHDTARRYDEFGWIAETASGRLLRCPTLFEDTVKLILTTNCSWAFTTQMTTALIERYGEPAPGGRRAFPTPARLARAGERELREKVRAGYRAPLLAKLFRMVARGEVDPEAWEHDRREVADLKRDMLALPGVGPYVAENLLRFLGRPDGLGLDSWLRDKYARVHHRGRKVSDRTIARRYARFGSWAGQALFCEMTRDWFDAEGRPGDFWTVSTTTR